MARFAPYISVAASLAALSYTALRIAVWFADRRRRRERTGS
jgi:hypothetical protein